MEDLEFLFDEKEQRIIELEEKKKKRKKRKKKVRNSSYIIFIIFILIYFSSDMSDVKKMSVEGNQFYSKNEILEIAGLSYQSKHILLPSFFLQYKLEKNSLIQRAAVEKNWYGNIHINIEEAQVLGYYIDESGMMKLVLPRPYKEIQVDQKHQSSVLRYPLISNFDGENLEKLAKAFSQKGKEISQDIISMISEILPFQRSYDANMVKIVMQDGNIVFSSYDGIVLLNDYKKVVKELKDSNMCLELDTVNNSILSTKCK